MEGVMYFGKVNMISEEINKVLKNEISLSAILSNVILALKDGISFSYSRPIKTEDGFDSEEITYSLAVTEKGDDNLKGFIYKKSFLHYKSFNNIKNELDSRKIENIEGIRFQYDVFRELVAYTRSQRFGYKEFLHAFQGIINNACKDSNLNYEFTVTQYNEGLDIANINSDLRQDKIQTLKIKYQIPNPDPDTLKAIQNNPEKTISEFEAANLLTKNVVYQAASKEGLNMDSILIEHEINNLSNLHSHIDFQKATRNGYIEVETTDIHGVVKSTADARPLVRHFSNENKFDEEAHLAILSYVAKSHFENS